MITTCIMEVRPGQHSATIAQAMAHNTSTIMQDQDMFKPLLEARGEHELLEKIERAHQHLIAAYQEFLAVFADELNTHIHTHGDVPDDAGHNHGNERQILVTSVDPDWPAQLHHHHLKPQDEQFLHDAGFDGNLLAAELCARAETYETR